MHQSLYSKNDIRHYFGPVSYCPTKSPCVSAVPTLKERRAYFTTKTSCPIITTSKVWREPVPLDIFAKTVALSDRVRSARYPSSFDPLARHPFDPPDSRPIPSPVAISPSTDAPMGCGNEISVAAENVNGVTDATVSAGIYTGIGLGTSFGSFTTIPEEEIIFELQDSAHVALVALLYHALATSTPVSDLGPPLIWEKFVLQKWSSFWRFHQPVYCVCIRCRTSSLRWVIALIYKLLLIAWDLWQYKTD